MAFLTGGVTLDFPSAARTRTGRCFEKSVGVNETCENSRMHAGGVAKVRPRRVYSVTSYR